MNCIDRLHKCEYFCYLSESVVFRFASFRGLLARFVRPNGLMERAVGFIFFEDRYCH